jgi:hypothetical protein
VPAGRLSGHRLCVRRVAQSRSVWLPQLCVARRWRQQGRGPGCAMPLPAVRLSDVPGRLHGGDAALWLPDLRARGCRSLGRRHLSARRVSGHRVRGRHCAQSQPVRMSHLRARGCRGGGDRQARMREFGRVYLSIDERLYCHRGVMLLPVPALRPVRGLCLRRRPIHRMRSRRSRHLHERKARVAGLCPHLSGSTFDTLCQRSDSACVTKCLNEVSSCGDVAFAFCEACDCVADRFSPCVGSCNTALGE